MIDKLHQGVLVPTARFLEKYEDDVMEPDIKMLYMILEALEADRESMRQALLGMRTKKAQLMLLLLREIEQQLAQDATPVGTGVEFVPVVHHLPKKQAVGVADTMVKEDRKTSVVGAFSKAALFKDHVALCSLSEKQTLQLFHPLPLNLRNRIKVIGISLSSRKVRDNALACLRVEFFSVPAILPF